MMMKRTRTQHQPLSSTVTRFCSIYICSIFFYFFFQLTVIIGSANALARPSSQQNRKKHRPLAQRSGVSKLDVEIDLWKENNFKVSKGQQRRNKQRQQQGGGFGYVIGSDDSGGGCIAGPIVTASLCLLRRPPLDTESCSSSEQQPQMPPILEGVADSKQLSEQDRQRTYQLVTSQPETYAWSYATRSPQQIDQLGVAKATLECFHESIESLVHKLNRLQQNQDQEVDDSEDAPPRMYSIVDGKHSPKDLSIQSRPWIKADSTVYTVALASIMARVLRETIMQEAAEQYPEYGFRDHGGYPTKNHTLALHQYGPSPLHRLSSKPVQSRGGEGMISRNDFLTTCLVTSVSLLSMRSDPSVAKTVDPKTGISLPDKGEIEAAVPKDWSQADNPLEEGMDSKSLWGRLDPTNDAIFYQDPRFVEHVDPQAVGILTTYISNIVAGDTVESVLDLCSSWTSHIDRTVVAKRKSPLRVAGLGMNAKELQANELLTEWVVQDLNGNPELPYKDASFDVVFCQLSIDYLTKPLEVCAEIGRVLRSGGTVHFLFSNRLFLSKAVALWTGADDVDHAYIVACYLHFCSGDAGGVLFRDIQAKDLSIRKGRDQRIVGDPVYVVTGTKK